ncbi:MAG: FHA domain-containing protein [bacterium]
MALILEIRDARGVATWHRLDALPLTIGRGLANDIILDDPYVDAQHARIAIDENGVAEIHDLGSVNGVHENGSRRDAPVVLQPGAALRIGRTVLRFRDADEAIAPALVDAPAVQPTTAPRVSALPRLLTTTRGRLTLALIMVLAYAFNTWLGDTDRSSGSSVFGAALAFAAFAALWATVWSFVGRAIVRRFEFAGHVAVISLAMTAMLAWSTAHDWLAFFFPDARILQLLYMGIVLALLAALVAGHLSLSTILPRKRQWRAGFIVSGIMAVLFIVAALVADDKFSDVPKFANQLKPIRAAWIPTKTPTEFSGVMRELKDEVDKAAKKDADR